MKKTKPASCLHNYYGAAQTLRGVVLSKIAAAARPALNEQKRKKGLYALGSN